MRRGSLAALFALTACGLLAPPAAEVGGSGPTDPPPDSALVVLGHGEVAGRGWEVVAYRSRAGSLCWASSTNRVLPVARRSRMAPSSDRSAPFRPGSTTGSGSNAVLSADVRRVRIETDAGTVEADVRSLAPTGFDLTGFATMLPPRVKPTALVALDGLGSVLDRFELLPVEAIPDDGVAPTPAGP